jgi:hypothetical protein
MHFLRKIFTAVPAVVSLLLVAPGPATAEHGDVAYVGGSITRLGVVGAHRSGETSLWDSYPIGGGTLAAWVTDPYYFATFDAERNRTGPPTAVWLQLAFKDREAATYATPEARVQLAVKLLRAIRERVGAVPIYVSAMADYEPRGLCPSVERAPAMMRALRDTLVAEGWAVPGPKLPALDATQVSDGCHQNHAGQRAHGEVLRSFFP